MDFWKRLLLALLFLPLALHEAQALCPPIWPRVTFLQLYEGDLQKDTRDWQRAFRRWQALGTEEVILQWSAYGAPEGGPFPLVQEGLIPLLLDIAAEEGMELRLGLRYDPDLWQRREHHEPDRQSTATAGAPSELSRYFFRRQQDHEALLQLLAPLAAHPAFAGWYITDEIDDVTWREPAGR